MIPHKPNSTILYENSTGTTGNNVDITLSESIDNFKKIEVTFDICMTPGTKYAYGFTQEFDLTQNNLSNFLICVTIANTYWGTFSISGNVLTITRNRESNTTSGNFAAGNYIYITKVVGYK